MLKHKCTSSPFSGAAYLHATDGHVAVEDSADRRQERRPAHDLQVSCFYILMLCFYM